MSSYAKRRSAQRPSVTSVGSAAVRPGDDQPPRSPQFGGDEDGSTGSVSSAAISGGAGQYEDADVALNIGSSNAAPRVSRSAFDERVRSVRDRLREMMEKTAGDGDESSDEGGIECDPPPDSSKVPSSRGSKLGRAAVPPVGMAAPPDLESIPSSSSSSSTNVIAQTHGRPEVAGGGRVQPSVTSGRRRSHSILLDSDIQFQVESKNSSTAGSGRTSAGRMPPPEISNDSPPRSPASRATADVDSSQPVIGRDLQARVGLRIRVVDPKVARCVEPTGIIKEIRCEGTRVRVEHDGKDNPQRYYNTGKGGEYQLVLESASGEELAHATSAKDAAPQSNSISNSTSSSSSGSSSSKSHTAKLGSRPSRTPHEPPEIVDDEEEDDVEESEGKAEVKAVRRRSRYSEIRTAKRASKTATSAPAEDSASTPGQAPKNKAGVQEQSSSPEPAARVRYSERRSATSNALPEDHQIAANLESIPPTPRAKTSAKKRSSMPHAAPESAAPAEPAPAVKRYAERRSSTPNRQVAPASDPEAAPAPKRYSERRRATVSSPPSASKLPVEEEQEAAPKQRRYSEKRKSMRASQVSAAPTTTETPVQVETPSGQQEAKSPTEQPAPKHQSPAGGQGKEASGQEKSTEHANQPFDKVNQPAQSPKQESEVFFSRLKSLEETLSRDLKAVRDDVHSQIGAAENKIVARVLEELEQRIRQGSISTTGMIVAGSMDTKGINNKLKGIGQLDMDACSEPAPQGIGTPMNEEPEQELMAGGDVSDGSVNAGSRRGSDAWKPQTCDQTPQKCFPKPLAEVSNAELADNRQRLENIGSTARRVSASLGGGLMSNNFTTESEQQFADGMQTPDFASPANFNSQHIPPPQVSPDNLDEEMEHLAEMRRFASSVLNHANALAAGANPQDRSAPHSNQGGSMPPAWADRIRSPRTSVSRALDQPPGSHLQAARRQSALREAARTDECAENFNPPSRGFELLAQPPPQPPPVQSGQAPASSMQQWMAGARNAGKGGARRSASKPMRAPWSSAGSYEAEGTGASGGRLVF